MIIIGYQGIGKSTLGGKDNCIDLESGNFFLDGVRADNWYIPYCKIAEELSKQGYTVFVSSHECVRNQLRADSESRKFKGYVCCIVPDISLKKYWIDKLLRRWQVSNKEKDYKAYMNASSRYAENIQEIMSCGFQCYPITSIDYSLQGMVGQIKSSL